MLNKSKGFSCEMTFVNPIMSTEKLLSQQIILYKIIDNQRILSIESTDVNPSSALSENAKNKSFWILGDTVTFKVTGQQTYGKYSVWEIKVPSQSGPPSHYHTNLEEGFYILQGEFSFQYNENVVNATAGSFIHVQRGIIHTYKNVSKNISRLLVTEVPAGSENFIDS